VAFGGDREGEIPIDHCAQQIKKIRPHERIGTGQIHNANVLTGQLVKNRNPLGAAQFLAQLSFCVAITAVRHAAVSKCNQNGDGNADSFRRPAVIAEVRQRNFLLVFE
jgi:hypothetical protein